MFCLLVTEQTTKSIMADEAKSITEWLVKLKLDQYVSGFIASGYDEMASIVGLNDQDLDAIGVTLPGHKKRLMMAAKKLSDVPPVVHRPAQPTPKPKPRPNSVVSPPQPAKRPVSIAVAPPPRSPNTQMAATPQRHSLKAAMSVPEEPEPAPAKLPPSLPKRNAETSITSPPPASNPRPNSIAPPKVPKVTATSRPTSDADVDGPPPSLPKPNTVGPGGKLDNGAAKFMNAMKTTKSTKAVDPTADPALVIEVEDESMGVIRTVTIEENTDAQGAILLYTKAHNMSSEPESEMGAKKGYVLFEAFTTPNLERCLPPKTPLLKLRRKWPKINGVLIPGCRFILRAVETSMFNDSNVAFVGTLDKRSGSKSDSKNVKSWKTRHFRLEDDGLRYFKSPPKTQKAAKNPVGVWPIESWVVYSINTKVKGAKFPDFCFCLKFDTFPTWEPEEKDAEQQFNQECRVMSAPDAETRMKWITSIQAAQGVGSPDSFADARRQRMASVSGLPRAAEKPEHDVKEVASSDDEDPSPLPTTGGGAHSTTGRPISMAIPDDFTPIAAKKVRGVGFGNIFAEIPKKADTPSQLSQPQTQTQSPLLPPRPPKD